MPKRGESSSKLPTGKCSFRIPDAELLFSEPYECWAIHCDCGTTIMAATVKEAQASWRKHVEGEF